MRAWKPLHPKPVVPQGAAALRLAGIGVIGADLAQQLGLQGLGQGTFGENREPIFHFELRNADYGIAEYGM